MTFYYLKKMENKLYYLLPNWEEIDTDSDEIVELETPIYEDVPLNANITELYGHTMEDLMAYFRYAAEIDFYSIDTELILENLVKVIEVQTYIKEDKAIIKYLFEDGRTYVPEREFKVGECYDEVEINEIFKAAQEAAPHLFFVSLPTEGFLFDFEYEYWY